MCYSGNTASICLKAIFILLASNSLVALGSPLGECCLALESQQCVNSTSHTPNARCARSLAGAILILLTSNSLVALGSPLGKCCLASESQYCVNSTSHTPNARCARSLAGAIIVHRPALLAYVLSCQEENSDASTGTVDSA